jgi:hypothetical protein
VFLSSGGLPTFYAQNLKFLSISYIALALKGIFLHAATCAQPSLNVQGHHLHGMHCNTAHPLCQMEVVTVLLVLCLSVTVSLKLISE